MVQPPGTRYTTHRDPLVTLWCGIGEPPRTPVIDLSTPCFLCTDVVRAGSRRCAAVEPPRPSVKVPYTP